MIRLAVACAGVLAAVALGGCQPETGTAGGSSGSVQVDQSQGAVAGGNQGGGNQGSVIVRGRHNVVYVVSGNGNARVSYTSSSNGSSTTIRVYSSTWTHRVQVENGTEVTVTATGNGPLSCRITVDGRVVSSADSSGGMLVCRASVSSS